MCLGLVQTVGRSTAFFVTEKDKAAEAAAGRWAGEATWVARDLCTK